MQAQCLVDMKIYIVAEQDYMLTSHIENREILGKAFVRLLTQLPMMIIPTSPIILNNVLMGTCSYFNTTQVTNEIVYTDPVL